MIITVAHVYFSYKYRYRRASSSIFNLNFWLQFSPEKCEHSVGKSRYLRTFTEWNVIGRDLYTNGACCVAWWSRLVCTYTRIHARAHILGVEKFTRNTSDDWGSKKKKKQLYKHRSGNKSFPSYSHSYI